MVNILIIAFNRLDFTKKLIQTLVEIEPLSLYVAIDGPRSTVKSDAEKCKEVKDIIQAVDWKCDVEYLIKNHNIGCNKSVENAISWFFSEVEEGVILEDDCIPNISFFKFSAELLKRYRNNHKICQISGMSFSPFENHYESYRFSSLVNIWGWATWRRSWEKLIPDLSKWPDMKSNNIMKCYGLEKDSQEKLAQDCYDGNRLLTWGMKWRLTCLSNNTYSIIPKVNLTQNIGFNRDDSTSKTFYHPVSNITANSIDFPLIHPSDLSVDTRADEYALREYYDNIEST